MCKPRIQVSAWESSVKNSNKATASLWKPSSNSWPQPPKPASLSSLIQPNKTDCREKLRLFRVFRCLSRTKCSARLGRIRGKLPALLANRHKGAEPPEHGHDCSV